MPVCVCLLIDINTVLNGVKIGRRVWSAAIRRGAMRLCWAALRSGSHQDHCSLSGQCMAKAALGLAAFA